jgi:sortase A
VTNVRVGKLLVVISALAMMAALSACGGSDEGQTPPDNPMVPKAPAQKQSAGDQAPADKTLTVTVPRMERVKDSTFPNTSGDDEESLKNHAGIHLEDTGFPWQKEANVYLAGHRLGYPGYPSFLAFWDLDSLQQGDRVKVTDADGREYDYRVFQILEVDPTALYVTEPQPGKNILTLQSCTLPDYAQRLVVQAELEG